MRFTLDEKLKGEMKGEIEIEVRDRNGRVTHRHREPNLIKIFAKEMLSHRLPYSNVWDPTGGSGSGAWVPSGIDVDEEFAAKYILFGASYDLSSGAPLDNADPSYYTQDPVTGGMVPLPVNVGADNYGDLIKPVRISEPDRPLKKIESISFEPSYQPADSPLLSEDVRAINNVLVLETTLRLSEYNGYGTTSSDYFTIAEVALAGGRPLDTNIGACDCEPQYLFLQGVDDHNDQQIIATANGTSTVSIDPTVAADDVNKIREGDQVFLVAREVGTETYDLMGQLNPYYLVVSKTVGGRDVVLDRTPVDTGGTAITGPIGMYRSTLRIFSARILSVPFKKSSDFEIRCVWRISFA